MRITVDEIDWEKCQDRLPVIIQHHITLQVLMLGYMTRDALQATLDGESVVFFSRTKNRLWKKGESSGNTLQWQNMHLDCDQDTLLIYCHPQGPTCHTGDVSCFEKTVAPGVGFLTYLDSVIEQRRAEDDEASYTASLFRAGKKRMAQKVGEEGVETAIAALIEDDEHLSGEAADLIYHLIVLLRGRGLDFESVIETLRGRHR